MVCCTQAEAYGTVLLEVPCAAPPVAEKAFCDLCETTIAGLMARCPDCEWELCAGCSARLRGGTMQAPACPNPICSFDYIWNGEDAAALDTPAGQLRSHSEYATSLRLHHLQTPAVRQLLQSVAQEHAGTSTPLSCPLLPPAAAGTAAAAAAEADLAGGDWWRHVPETWRRRASGRGEQDYVFTPDYHELQPEHPHYERAMALLWSRHFLAKEPVIVRNVPVRNVYPHQHMLPSAIVDWTLTHLCIAGEDRLVGPRDHGEGHRGPEG